MPGRFSCGEIAEMAVTAGDALFDTPGAFGVRRITTFNSYKCVVEVRDGRQERDRDRDRDREKRRQTQRQRQRETETDTETETEGQRMTV